MTRHEPTSAPHPSGDTRPPFDAYPIPMWIYDVATLRFLAVNETAVVTYGYSRDEFLGMTLLDIRPPEDVDLLLADVDLHHDGLALPSGVWRHRRKDGSIFHVEISGQRTEFDGRPARLVVALDVSTRVATEEALRASEARLVRAQRVAHLGSWELDVRTGHLVWSDEIYRIFGLDPSAFPGTYEAFFATIHPDDRAAFAAVQVRAARGEARLDAEHRIVRPDGEVRWVHEVGELERDEAGRPWRLTGAVMDVTARKNLALERDRVDADRRANADRLRRMFRDAATGIAITTPDGRFLEANAAYCRMLGYTVEQLQATDLYALTHPDDREANRALLGDLMAGRRESIVHEKRYVHADGHVVWARLSVSMARDDHGQPATLIGVAEDVSEQKRAEEAARRNQSLLQIASRLGRMGAWSVDVVAGTHDWSDGARALHEVEPGTQLGFDALLDFYAPEDRPRVHEAFARCVADGTPFDEEARLIGAKGTERRVRLIGEAVRDEHGAVVRVVGALQDVTDQKLLEEQFLRAQRLETVGTLAGGIAHDLNNVLAPILMAVSLLEEDETDPVRREDLASIAACAQRGAEMVRQLLSFARGGEEGRREPVDLRRLVEGIQKIVRDTFPKDVVFRWRAPSDLWPIHGDATQIHQVLVNLCVNARDAMPRGGTLTIDLAHEVLDEVYARMDEKASPGPHVRLTVEDTGVGMPSQVLDRVFEPFFTTKEVGKGTGLGLSTVHTIVRGHGGFIRVRSDVGKGTRFEIYLPASLADDDARDLDEVTGELPRGRGEVVLVVDDEVAIRDVTRRTLERYGYEVLLASHGAEAVAQYARHGARIAAVLTDMAMPVMDGPATIAALRSMNPRVRILGSSGLATADAADPSDVGVYAFVPKPYTAETLLVAIRDLIDGPG